MILKLQDDATFSEMSLKRTGKISCLICAGLWVKMFLTLWFCGLSFARDEEQ